MVKKTIQQPDKDVWKALFALAVQIKKLYPWDFTYPDEVFGVKDIVSGQIAFVSIVGFGGRNLELNIFPGLNNLSKFLDFYARADISDPLKFYDIRQFQLSYINREKLRDEDNKIIKDLGLRFYGKNDWPCFRSILPGYVPWHLNKEEAHFLKIVLEQAVNVIQRLPKNHSLANSIKKELYLVRVQEGSASSAEWTDKYISMPMSDLPPIKLNMDMQMLNKVNNISRLIKNFEMGIYTIPSPVLDDDDRPFYAKNLIIVDHITGNMLGYKIIKYEPDEGKWQSEVANSILEILLKNNVRPSDFMIKTDFPIIIKTLSKSLSINLNFSKNLTKFEQIRKIFMAKPKS